MKKVKDLSEKERLLVLIGVVVILVVGLALMVQHQKTPGQAVEVWSDGQLLYTLPLDQDTTVVVRTKQGENTICVEAGTARVDHADCPDGTCVKQGKRQSGQIVCLPNRLVLKFIGEETVDSISG